MGDLIEVAGHVSHENGKSSEVVFKALRNKETLLKVGKGCFLEVDGRFFAGFLGVLLDDLIFRSGKGAVNTLDAWSIEQRLFKFPPAGFFQFLHGTSVTSLGDSKGGRSPWQDTPDLSGGCISRNGTPSGP